MYQVYMTRLKTQNDVDNFVDSVEKIIKRIKIYDNGVVYDV